MKRLINSSEKPFYITFFLVFFSIFCFAQNSLEFKGKVIDSETNKPLAMADLLVIGTNISTITNTEGEFLLKVPNTHLNKKVSISFLGYKKQEILLSKFKKKGTKIKLTTAATVLAHVDINAPKSAEDLVRKALSLKAENYINEATVMTAFYRETIKKRNKNASLSEAVLKVYKQPYTTNRKDAITLVKARKNTDYSRLDTLAIKLQGGPFSMLQTDIIKYPDYVFSENNINDYNFSFNRATKVDNELVYVVNFKPRKIVSRPLYYGTLYINANSYALTSAVFNLNVENREEASKLFVKRKPKKAIVYPTEAKYRINYRTKNGKWHYGYSKIILTFKVKWKHKLFNSRYTLQSEMTITDWDKNVADFKNKPKNRLKASSIILDEASGFADPEFWGEYNIIEPEKSIESAIKKISKQLKKK